jgi:hypothetical protein
MTCTIAVFRPAPVDPAAYSAASYANWPVFKQERKIVEEEKPNEKEGLEEAAVQAAEPKVVEAEERIKEATGKENEKEAKGEAVLEAKAPRKRKGRKKAEKEAKEEEH